MCVRPPAGGPTPLGTKVIVSYHDFQGTPDDETLRRLVETMWAAGADVAKIVATAEHVADARRMLALLDGRSGARPRPPRVLSFRF